ncbi:MAG: histidinol-phosphatase HisJ family protein [Candidatus Mcinerneyibacterium aminivorans]|uniref:Histidinol-phosphatase n=1 Tax=Candidatus Mcinerneyibacterium aminivorans TaxID=2703815 RepID=A0A5D0MCA7_9BACT|nr:MAG: histidinol-phosphatase HisJ family protein [Candidatus Mcinerneyibacterium aminivorans]
MFKLDYHLHTNFSSDSSINPEYLICKAINQNYNEIVITDHFDLNPIDIKNYGLLNLDDYTKTIDDLKTKYKEQIIIKKGLEVGEYHQYIKKIDDIINKNDYEVIIGSIHRTEKNINMSIPVDNPFDKSAINSYYKANLEMVKSGMIDVLGHLGIFQRYYPEYANIEDYYNIIDSIFNYMKLNNIALEINFSGLRKPIGNLIPSIGIIKKYINNGGNLLTIGSDLHSLNEMKDSFYNKAIKMLKDNGINFLSRKHNGQWNNIKI